MSRVAGHGLCHEGQGHDSAGNRIWPPSPGLAHGKCECGALSPAVASNLKRKGWHKWHKAQVSGDTNATRTFELSADQLDALRALLGLVHYDDLADALLAILPIDFHPSRGQS